jgi:hypothetical protein
VVGLFIATYALRPDLPWSVVVRVWRRADVEVDAVDATEAIEIGSVILTLTTPDLYGTCN